MPPIQPKLIKQNSSQILIRTYFRNVLINMAGYNNCYTIRHLERHWHLQVEEYRCGSSSFRDRNKEKCPLVRRTSDRVRELSANFSLVQKIAHDKCRTKFRKNKHNNKTNSAALCNRLLLFVIKYTIAYYSVCARVYKKTVTSRVSENGVLVKKMVSLMNVCSWHKI